MEFKVQKSLLESLVSKIYPVVQSRSTLTALSNILIEARGDKIYVSATDLETSATAISGGAEISEQGAIALNGKDVYNIIKELSLSTINFKVDNLLTTLECEKGKFTMAGISKDEFPTLMEVEQGCKVSIPYNLLERGIDKTLFVVAAAASGEIEGIEGPPGGALLDLQQHDFRLVTTDGHRLALFKTKSEIGKISRLLISSKVWREVAKFSSGIDVAFEENKVGFYSENMVLVSRLMEKKFPPYESVIPKDNDIELVASREELALALRRALVFAPDISKLIKFILKPNTLLIETGSEAGESKEELSCKYGASEFEIAYNGSYLLSIITKIETDEVKFLFKDAGSVAIISPVEQKEGEEIIYLLMPIRLE